MDELIEKQRSVVRKKQDELENRLKKLDEELEEEYKRKCKEHDDELKKYIDPTVLKKRHDDLVKLKSSLFTLEKASKTIELDIRMPIIPGVHLYAKPENQRAVASFLPMAYETILKKNAAADVLKSIRDDHSEIVKKLNYDTMAITNAHRNITTRFDQLQKRRSDLDLVLQRRQQLNAKIRS